MISINLTIFLLSASMFFSCTTQKDNIGNNLSLKKETLIKDISLSDMKKYYIDAVNNDSKIIFKVYADSIGKISFRDSILLHRFNCWHKVSFDRYVSDFNSGSKHVYIRNKGRIYVNYIVIEQLYDRISQYDIEQFIERDRCWEVIHRGKRLGKKNIVEIGRILEPLIRVKIISSDSLPYIKKVYLF